MSSASSTEEPQPRRAGRILALDVGARTIGMAVSDELGITAQGLPTWRRVSKRADLEELARVVREFGISEVVMGYPLRMSGVEGTQAERMQEFAAAVRKRLELPVHLWDERLTTAEAQRLLRENEVSVRRRRVAVDRMAAVLILQSWLAARAAGGATP